MKRLLLACIVLMSITLTAGAQNICGVWKASELNNGTTYYKFFPNNKAELYFVISPSFADGIDGKIIITFPGNYLVEGGKSLTVAFDKSQGTFDFKIVYTDNDIKAFLETTQGKETIRQINESIYANKNQVMQMVRMAVPASYLYQIVYLNQCYMSVVNAAVGVSQRYDMKYLSDVDTPIWAIK